MSIGISMISMDPVPYLSQRPSIRYVTVDGFILQGLTVNERARRPWHMHTALALAPSCRCTACSCGTPWRSGFCSCRQSAAATLLLSSALQQAARHRRCVACFMSLAQHLDRLCILASRCQQLSGKGAKISKPIRMHPVLQGARLLEDIVRWGTKALFSPEALAAAQQQDTTIKAEGGSGAVHNSAALVHDGGPQPSTAVGSEAPADPAAANGSGSGTAALASAPTAALPLSEPALQQLVAIADEVRKSADWRPAARATPAGSTEAASDSVTNGPVDKAAVDAASSDARPKAVDSLGDGLEGAAARDWQPNECEESEISEAGMQLPVASVYLQVD